MANARISANRYEEASVDTDPGVNGFGCNPVSVPKLAAGGSKKSIYFYISQIGTGATVTLQWKKSGATSYTKYDDFTEVTRQAISDDSDGTLWRAIVEDNNQGSSGASVFGIDW